MSDKFSPSTWCERLVAEANEKDLSGFALLFGAMHTLTDPEDEEATSMFCLINESRTKRQIAAEQARRKAEKELATIAELTGSDPDFTGGMTTKEYMDTVRGRERSEMGVPNTWTGVALSVEATFE